MNTIHISIANANGALLCGLFGPAGVYGLALEDLLPNSDEDLARVLDRDAANEKRRQFLAQSNQNPRLALAIGDYKKALEPTPEPPPRPATTSERQEYQGPTAVPIRTRRDTLEMVESVNVAPGLDPRRTPTQKRITALTATTGAGAVPASASASASAGLLNKEEVSPWRTEGQAALAIDKAALPSAHAPAPTPAPVPAPEGVEPASLGSHRRPIVATWRDPRRRGIALALGLVVLAAVVWLLWPKPTSKESMGLTGPAGSNHRSRGVEAPPPQTAAPTVPTAGPPGTASPEPSTSPSTPAAEPSAQPVAPTAKTPTPKRPAGLPAQTAATAPTPAPSGTAAPVAPAPSPPAETATPSAPPPTTPPPAPVPTTKPSPDDEPRLWK